VLDESALEHEAIYVSGGRRGLEIELAPADLQRLTNAVVAPVAR
jgi:Cys-tRNA(Pro)/Cys-tRNA(Cys) deacylase